jgi:hypothetical protein
MSEKTGKKKTKKAPKAAADPSVLGSLRSTRPTRLGGERRASAAKSSAAAATKPRAAGTKPRAAKSSAAATKPSKPRAAKSSTQPPRTAPPPRAEDRPGTARSAVQAAGELAQIGLTVGGQMLKRAARRLPRP